MTAVTETRAPAHTGRPRSLAAALAGTGVLFRFDLRRDRVRIPVWITALLLGTVLTATSLEGLYTSAADRQATAETLDSPAGLALNGPEHYLSDYHFGSMMSHQMLGFTTVLVALMSVLMVTRHTRTEEEAGRAELVRASPVGRHAHMAAALTLAAAVNVALALVLTVALGSLGMEDVTWGGSLLYGAAHAAVGIAFAAVAAVTVQITEHSRGASGMALAAVGVAYVLRAAGDVSGNILSWLSPIGWAQQTYAYLDNRWWPLLLALLLAAAASATGFFLSTRRDVGAGLRQVRPGPPRASGALLRPVGFALRLHRGVLIGFGIGLLLLGASYGSILGDVEEMIESVDALDDFVAQMGGASVTESFASTVMIVIAVVASVYVVMAALRPRAEESAGRAEPLLATALSRSRWMGSHVAVAMAGGVVVLVLAGLGFGLAGAVSAGDGSLVLSLTGAAVAYAPALWVTVGFAVVLLGWLPRAAAATWLVPAYAFTVGYLGQMLQFPAWLNNLSPFGHVPQLPAAELRWPPLLILTAVAAGLVALGLAGFSRRDLRLK